MDHRFSTLFIQGTPITNSDQDATMKNLGLNPKSQGKSKATSLRQALRKLFGTSKENKKASPISKTIEPVLSQLSQQVWSEFASTPSQSSSRISKVPSVSNRSLMTKPESIMSTQRITVHPPKRPSQAPTRKESNNPPSSNRHSFSYTTTNKKRSSTNSTRDSKFSSISSLPSLAAMSLHPPTQRSSSPGPSLTLSAKNLALMQSLTRRIARQLRKHDYLTNHLAANLLYLFERKQVSINAVRRVRFMEREAALSEVWKVKEGFGRGFLRRGVLVGRSEGALNLLSTALDSTTRAPSTRGTNRRASSYHPSLSGASSPSSYKTARSYSDPSLPTPSTIQTNPEITLPLNTLHDTTSTLLSCLAIQTVLNSDLKNDIYKACLNSRWNGLPGGGMNGNVKGNANDRIMMNRFIGFVEGRVALLEECGDVIKNLVGRLEVYGKSTTSDL